MSAILNDDASPGVRTAELYEPFDFLVVRAPLLPIETYHALGATVASLSSASTTDPPAGSDDIRRALAIGSVTFLDALRPDRNQDGRRRKIDGTLRRYLIRMSTRPTPFGLFAGVGLGRWGDRTDLQLSSGRRRQRTRPDMGWLMSLVDEMESDPEIRRHLQLVTNPTALMRAGRVLLAERVSRGEATVPPAVSIRATGVVRQALAAARTPVPYGTLVALLLERRPGATPEKVERLLTELWEQTLLLTDLRPPLTIASPAQYVVDRLDGIAAAAALRARIQMAMDDATDWDTSLPERGAERYRRMVADAATIGDVDQSPFQVDTTVQLDGYTVSRRVGDEAARAAELLLRLTPLPRGPAHLAGYRRLFEQRYTPHHEVPLLELLDPNFGLGPPPTLAGTTVEGGISPAQSFQRNQVLLELAVTAMRERTRCVSLDDDTLQRLETWKPTPSDAPPSLDLYVSIAAASRDALDAGDFEIVVGPNVGAMAAGRTLGRFADLLPQAEDALRGIAAYEEALEPDKLWAELTYQPRRPRLGNVSIRPNVRRYEIAVGVSAGRDASCTIPVDELVVGVRSGRFYVRWPAANRDVVITAGHMLTHVRAPAVCRFLSEVGRDGSSHLAGFQWGIAATLPYLPRVRVGRIVLALAQWRLAAGSIDAWAVGDADAFRKALDRWRDEWQVPQHVALSSGDNRLLLDLADPGQADELRSELSRRRPDHAVLMTEVYPGLDDACAIDDQLRHYVTELVVPLGLRRNGRSAAAAAGVAANPTAPERRARNDQVRPLGSEWVFAKLYGGLDFENELLTSSIRSFADRVRSAGMADQWFFIRYNDPDRHLRLRFRGDPERLLRELIPALCAWVDDLINEDACRRFVLDTYEREIERFGGDAATSAAETLFAADSEAVIDLLALLHTHAIDLPRIPLGVLTVDTLLDGLGVDAEARAPWCRDHARGGRDGGADYRTWKGRLRPLLADRDNVRAVPGGSDVVEIVARLHESAAAYRSTIDELAAHSRLTRPANELWSAIVHLHLNRLLGNDSSVERRVINLLGRVRGGLHPGARNRWDHT